MKKFTFLALAASTALSMGTLAYAANESVDKGQGIGEVQSTPTTSSQKTPSQAMNQRASVSTRTFVEHAAIGNEFEVETSKLALDRSKDSNIRDFAQKMIDDHSKASDNLKAAAPTDMDPTLAEAKLDPKHQQIFDHLKNTSDANFNAAYLKTQKNAHAEANSLFSSYARHGDSKDLRDFAKETLPTIEEHERHLNNLQPTGAGAVKAM